MDKEVISYFLTNLEDRVPFPAPGFPNMTILNAFPSLPDFPDSSFALVTLRNRVREGTVGGIDLPSLDAAEQQCLDDHCRGDISIGRGEERERRKGRGGKASQSRSTVYIYGEISNTAGFDANGDWGKPL